MLHVTVLGEQAITGDGAGVQTRSSRAVALVAFLVAHVGVPQPRQRIAGMFWPDSTDAQALTNLRRELHHLRQALGDDRSLVVTPRNLCWRDSGTCRVDLRIFDNERQARPCAGARRPDLRPQWPCSFRCRRVSGQPGKPAEGLRHLELAAQLASGAVWLSVGTRSDVQGTAFAAHAHWLLGHDAEALSARHDAIKLARAIDHPYCLAVALAYGSITHQMRHDLPELREMVGELRELCDRYGFAYYREWGLILDGWSRPDDSGIDLARQGIANLKAAGSFARWPYWLSLLADLLARNDRRDAARACLDAALAAGRQRDDLWWLPEVMRLRAAYDEPEAAISRLCSAAEMAAAHGSPGLLRRCEHDLGMRGVRTAPPSVLPAG